MTKVYFIRHAEPDYNDLDAVNRALTEKGRGDTYHVANFLKDKEISAVLSSPYQRSFDTVATFAHQMGMEVLSDGRADDGAVVIVIARNARVGVHLRQAVNGRHVPLGQMVDLKGVNDNHRQADDKERRNQRAGGEDGPGFSFHTRIPRK